MGETTFLDVWSPEELNGERLAPDHLRRSNPTLEGHAPVARSIPWMTTEQDGTFKSVDEPGVC